MDFPGRETCARPRKKTGARAKAHAPVDIPPYGPANGSTILVSGVSPLSVNRCCPSSPGRARMGRWPKQQVPICSSTSHLLPRLRRARSPLGPPYSLGFLAPPARESVTAGVCRGERKVTLGREARISRRPLSGVVHSWGLFDLLDIAFAVGSSTPRGRSRLSLPHGASGEGEETPTGAGSEPGSPHRMTPGWVDDGRQLGYPRGARGFAPRPCDRFALVVSSSERGNPTPRKSQRQIGQARTCPSHPLPGRKCLCVIGLQLRILELNGRGTARSVR